MYTCIQHSMLLCLKLACSKELLCHIYLCNFSGIILFTPNNVIWIDSNKIVHLSVYLNNTVCFFSNNTENENLETVWQGKITGTCIYSKLSYIFIHSIKTSCKRLVKMKFKLKQLQSSLILNFLFLLAWGELQLQCLSQHKRNFNNIVKNSTYWLFKNNFNLIPSVHQWCFQKQKNTQHTWKSSFCAKVCTRTFTMWCIYMQLSSKPLSLTEGIFFHTWYDWSSSSRAFSQLFLILSLRDNEIFEVWLLNSSLQGHCDDWLWDKLPLMLWVWESTLPVTEPEISKKEWVISPQVLKLF